MQRDVEDGGEEYVRQEVHVGALREVGRERIERRVVDREPRPEEGEQERARLPEGERDLRFANVLVLARRDARSSPGTTSSDAP